MTDAEIVADTAAEETRDVQAAHLLFNKWDLSEVEIKDPGLVRYVNTHSMIVPHSCGKLAGTQFAKSEMLIVERLINKLMQTEHNTGKKELVIRIVKDAFEIIHKKTKRNPVMVLVEAIANAGSREESVRLKYGGINVPKSVDTAPQRRVDSALTFIARGVRNASHKKKKPVAAVLADELIAAAAGDSRCFSVSKKEERERVAKSAR
jgi:small subunit ribosomal protein S7